MRAFVHLKKSKTLLGLCDIMNSSLRDVKLPHYPVMFISDCIVLPDLPAFHILCRSAAKKKTLSLKNKSLSSQ